MKRSELKILVVDDEIALTDTIRQYLELEDFNPRTANTGNQALKILQQEDFDAVLSDIQMPDGSGTDLLHALSQYEERPVVYLYSGQIDKNGQISIQELLNKGAQQFFNKPIDLDQFIELLVDQFKLEN